ncbi:SDR family oxidoreductase [Luteibacter aegosomatis]|uniref:SDR family NAD(P)-dependent oxidoreductase n=1 Tax=Luteibacter aegosomatis TaxID=2911537 RepID=UPI001FFC18B7|nr:SDR family oxidoreductase [Luteibacter aegosomatis]UPG84360.1 SDR family oxidoreductase [Luteibacter aegosomatis]
MTTETAFITGASSGIGLHLAHRFAAEGHPLFIVAPDAGELDAVAREIRQRHGVDVTPLAADLEDRTSFEAIGHALADKPIDILVNNAGHGFKGAYADVPIATHLSVLRLNVEAVLRLTSIVLPTMVARGSGRILNTASIAGFEPGPTMAVYHASKAFILSWSEAIATELEGSGVTVTALCPGPTDTDFFPKGDIEESFAFQKGNLMDPEDVANEGYRAVMKGERIVVPGAVNKALVFSRRFMSEHAQSKLNEKMYEDVDRHSRDRGDKESTPGAP